MLLTFFNNSKAGLNPEKIFIKNVNIENGLSQCVVSDMTVDSKGFLWVGTFDGLNRFDGSNLMVYKHIPGDSTSLPSSKIFKLLADNNAIFPIRLQAHERLIIFVERINPVNLLIRLHQKGIEISALQNLVINLIIL